MRKNVFVFIMMLICINLYSQNATDIDKETTAMIQSEQYEELITKYASTDLNLSYTTLYNIAIAYYLLSDDENTLKFSELAIEKDTTQSAPYFFKGSTLNYMGKTVDAIPFLQKAISLESDSLKLAQAYGNLGYSYYNINETDSAMHAYKEASDLDPTNPQFYAVLGELYNANNDIDKSLKYYYLAKNNSSILDDAYNSILFNIGVLEQENDNTEKAEASYKALIEIDPTDFHTYARLIQLYNKTKEYDKIPPLKAVLYDAHEKQLIKDENLSDMFCIDQFTVDSTQVRVFERYQNDRGKKIYRKIVFYILGDNEDQDYTIQTEYSPSAVANNEAMYMLCASTVKGYNRRNYGIGFDDETKYENIKNTVIEILKKDPKPFD